MSPRGASGYSSPKPASPAQSPSGSAQQQQQDQEQQQQQQQQRVPSVDGFGKDRKQQGVAVLQEADTPPLLPSSATTTSIERARTTALNTLANLHISTSASAEETNLTTPPDAQVQEAAGGSSAKAASAIGKLERRHSAQPHGILKRRTASDSPQASRRARPKSANVSFQLSHAKQAAPQRHSDGSDRVHVHTVDHPGTGGNNISSATTSSMTTDSKTSGLSGSAEVRSLSTIRQRFSPWNRLMFALRQQPTPRPDDDDDDDDDDAASDASSTPSETSDNFTESYGDDVELCSRSMAYLDDDAHGAGGGGGGSGGSDEDRGVDEGRRRIGNGVEETQASVLDAVERRKSIQFVGHDSVDSIPRRSRRGNRRRSSRISKLPKYTVGLEWMEVMKHRVQHVNQQFSSAMNLVFIALESSWRVLAFAYFAGVFLTAAVLAGLFFGCGCHDSLEYSKILLLVAQQIMTGPAFIESSDIDIPELSSGCIFLGFVSSACTIIFQAFLLSMAVRKLMKPKPAIAFTRKLVVNTRNGVPCLQARVINLRGNLISDVKLHASRVRPVKTQEGERHHKIEELTFTGPHMMKFPGIYTHTIDESSPLYREFASRNFISGYVWVEFVGYDHVLTEDVHQLWLFELPGDAIPCSRFQDMVLKGTSAAIADGSYKMAINMANFDRIVRTHPSGKCCQLCRSSCPFGSCAKRRAQAAARVATAVRENGTGDGGGSNGTSSHAAAGGGHGGGASDMEEKMMGGSDGNNTNNIESE